MKPSRDVCRLRRGREGFSLIELMVAVTVLGILMAIAIPAYRDFVTRAKRSAAQSVLLEIVAREEQYAATQRAYFATPAPNNLTGLGMSIPGEVQNNYDITITLTNVLGTNDGFIATATAKGAQLADGNLQINQFGLRMPLNKW